MSILKNISEIFADRIKTVRKEMGETQEQFAETIGYSLPYLKKLEKGESIPPIETLNIICKAINDKNKNSKIDTLVSVGYLIGEYEEKTFTENEVKNLTGLSGVTTSRLMSNLDKASSNNMNYRWYRNYLSLLEHIVNDEQISIIAFKNAQIEEDIKKAERIAKDNPVIDKVIQRTEKELDRYALINVNDLQLLYERFFKIASEEGLDNPKQYITLVNCLFEKRNLHTRKQALISVINDVVTSWCEEAYERERRIEEEHTTNIMPI